MIKLFKGKLSEFYQKSTQLNKLIRERKNLMKIQALFQKRGYGYNPTTYRKIWKRLEKLSYQDIPNYKVGFSYFYSQQSSQPIYYSDSRMKKDYKRFRKSGFLHPKKVKKDCIIPFYQCLYWTWVDMKEIQKFISKKLSEVREEINFLTFNW